MHARGLTVSMLNEPNLACPLQTLVGKGWSGRGVGCARGLCLCGGSRRYGWRRTFVRDDILPTRRHLCVFSEQTTPPTTAPVATSLGREQVSKRPRCRVVTQIYVTRLSDPVPGSAHSPSSPCSTWPFGPALGDNYDQTTPSSLCSALPEPEPHNPYTQPVCPPRSVRVAHQAETHAVKNTKQEKHFTIENEVLFLFAFFACVVARDMADGGDDGVSASGGSLHAYRWVVQLVQHRSRIVELPEA
jgi:hypothetical protein